MKLVFAKVKHFLKQDPVFAGLIIVTIFLCLFFRTYNYPDRVHIEADNSRDVQIAVYAFDHGKIPLIGQFSSAGPFFYGPWWYWFLEVISAIPLGYLTHWYFMTFLSFIFVLLIFYLGYEIGGEYVGALSALYAAISPAVISNSFSAWNPSIVPLLALVSLIFMVRFFKHRRLLDIFLVSFVIGLAITIHFQSILILPVLVAVGVLIIFSKNSSKILVQFALMILGFLIPFLPLLYFEISHNWFDSKNLIIYLAVDQYKIWVPNRWLTYIGGYWPGEWGEVVGGSYYLGLGIITLVAVLVLANISNIQRIKYFILVLAVFLGEIILYRYYRGERFSYYSFFSYPAVILISAWACFELFKRKRFTGALFISVIVLFTVKSSAGLLQPTEISFSKVVSLKDDIYKSYPGSNFAIYSCFLNGNRVSRPLSLFIYKDARSSDKGLKVMVCEVPGNKLTSGVISNEQILAQPLEEVTTSRVYHSTVEWWQDNPPVKGSGNMFEFIKLNTGSRFLKMLLSI